MKLKHNWLYLAALIVLAIPLAFMVINAGAVYIGDGSKQNSSGGWDITDYGKCVTGIKADGTMSVDTTLTSRPDCLTTYYPAYTTEATCLAFTNSESSSHYWASMCLASDGTAISLKGLDRNANMCEQAITAAGKTPKGWVCVDSGYTTSATCTAAFLSWDSALSKCVNPTKVQATCTGAGATGGTTTLAWTSRSWASACTAAWVYTGPAGDGAPGFCYTTVNLTTAYGTSATCPITTPGFSWGSSKCTFSYGITGYANAAITMKDKATTYAAADAAVDLSALTQGQCLANGASWSTGTVKSGTSSVATTPAASTIATVTATRAGCLECHNSTSGNNGYAERWKESYLKTGHKNMLRKVTAGKSWNGPNGSAHNTDGTNGINFGTSTTNAYVILANPYCSDTTYTTQTTCEAAAKTWIETPKLFYLYGNWMAPNPTLAYNTNGDGVTTSYSCAACHTTGWSNSSKGLCSDTSNTTQATCTAAGATWVASTGIQGTTGAEPAASFSGIKGVTGVWDLDGIQCTRCHAATFPAVTSGVTTLSSAQCSALGGTYSSTTFKCTWTENACKAAGGVWDSASSTKCTFTSTHNLVAEGGDITNLCFGCHQSPATDYSSVTDTTGKKNVDPTVIPTGSGHGANWGREFNGHVLGNQFLNSPHAQFSGTITPNNLGKWNLNYDASYASTFGGNNCRTSTTAGSGSILATVIKDGEIEKIKSLADCNLANGKTSGDETSYGYWQSEGQGSCSTCHDVHQSIVPAVNAEEPLRRECVTCHTDKEENINHAAGRGTPLQNPAVSCEVCHMPKSTSEGLPMHLWRINSDPNYDTFPAQAEFQGGTCSINTFDADGYAVNSTEAKCTTAGGTWTAASAKTRAAKTAADGSYTKAVWVDLDAACGQCHGGSKGSGAVANGARYLTKLTLAKAAKTMHGGLATENWIVASFTKTQTPSQLNVVDFDASGSTCPSGATCTYAWDFGDSSTDTVVKPSHTFAAAGGTFNVKLTVSASGYPDSSVTLPVVVSGSAAPVAGMTVSATDRNLTKAGTQIYVLDEISVTDTSTDANSDIEKTIINWGDRTTEEIASGSTATHSYIRNGAKKITLTVTDSTGRKSQKTATVVVVALTGKVSGTVTNSAETPANVAGAKVVLKNVKGKTVKSATTKSNGSYSLSNLSGGNYTVEVSKSGCTSTSAAASITKSVASVSLDFALGGDECK